MKKILLSLSILLLSSTAIDVVPSRARLADGCGTQPAAPWNGRPPARWNGV
jgi:hypothetical protein